MLQYFVSIDVMGKFQVLHAGGGYEYLQKEGAKIPAPEKRHE